MGKATSMPVVSIAELQARVEDASFQEEEKTGKNPMFGEFFAVKLRFPIGSDIFAAFMWDHKQRAVFLGSEAWPPKGDVQQGFYRVDGEHAEEFEPAVAQMVNELRKTRGFVEWVTMRNIRFEVIWNRLHNGILTDIGRSTFDKYRSYKSRDLSNAIERITKKCKQERQERIRRRLRREMKRAV